jgi:hypothetical protein
MSVMIEIEGARVECYAGSRGEETPRAVVIGKTRLDVAEIIFRKRVSDRASGLVQDVWRCRLADGRVVETRLLEDGRWRVSAAD